MIKILQQLQRMDQLTDQFALLIHAKPKSRFIPFDEFMSNSFILRYDDLHCSNFACDRPLQ